jgi:diadenosine tetraphosphate (Ap4A) HIT family hydrolase
MNGTAVADPPGPMFEPAQRPAAGCELCRSPGGRLVASQGAWRIIRVDDADFPAFYRLVHREHVAEMSDLPAIERTRCLEWLVGIEQILRETLAPTKINLASLGNMVPHLHWHVIARFDWDSHFPQPVWGARQRAAEDGKLARLREALPAVEGRLAALFQGAG